jgi:hypothetical protein
MQVRIIRERGEHKPFVTDLEENKDILNARISDALTRVCTCTDCSDPGQVSIKVYRGGDEFVIPVYQITYSDGSMYNLDYGYLSAEQVKNKHLREEEDAKAWSETHQTVVDLVPKVAPLQEADPTGRNPHEAGAKLDAGKAPILSGVIQYFPRALREVAKVSQYGMTKYTWKGWESVPNGIVRYGDALGRHLVDEIIDGPMDPSTKLRHAAQVAWNALARLELIIQEEET